MNILFSVKCKSLLWVLLGALLVGLIGCGGGGKPAPNEGFGALSGTVDRSSTDLDEVIVQIEGTDLQTTPDADGNFTFSQVPPGEYTVAVLQAGRPLGAAVRAQVMAGRRTQLGPLSLRPAGQIAGLVTTPDPQTGTPQPVGQARVVARPAGEVVDFIGNQEAAEEGEDELPEPPSPFRVALTQPDGSYQIRGVAPGHYVLEVTHPRFQSSQREVDVEAGQTTAADFTLQPLDPQALGSVAGTVSDSDGNPLGQVRVELCGLDITGRPAPPNTPPAADFDRLDPAFLLPRPGELVTYTDEQGRYALRGIPPGTYRILAAKRGYSLGDQEIQVQAGTTLTVDFVLTSRLVEISGTVLGLREDGSRVPLEAARVFALEFPPLARPQPGAGNPRRGDEEGEVPSWPGARLAALTDSNGRFQLQVTPGPILLIVHKEGFHPARQLVTADPAAPPVVTFELRPQRPEPGPKPLPLKVELILPAAEFPLGTPVEMTLRVTNPTSETVRAYTSYPGGYDFAVHSGGEEIWRWSHDKVFVAMVGQLVLAPGEVREFRETWDQKDNEGQPVPAGAYMAIGFLATHPRLRTDPVPFQIVNPASP